VRVVWEEGLAGRADGAVGRRRVPLWNSGSACVGDLDAVMGWMARREVGRSMLYTSMARNSRPRWR
jgi:hypothetical protein